MVGKVLPVLIAVLIASCGDAGPKRPLAEKGSIDVSGWNFARDGAIELRGEWDFCWMRLVPPDDFTGTGCADQRYLAVPGRWSPGWRVYFPEYGRGYATYRLRVITGPVPSGVMGIRINRIPTAYSLYVNGSLISLSGQAGTSAETTVPCYSDSAAPLPETDRGYDVVVHIANFHAPTGGIDAPVELGDLTSLQKSRQTGSILAVFIATVLLLLGCLQLLMYFFQRTERHYLYFGLMYLCMMLYSAGLNSQYWSDIAPLMAWGPVYSAMAMAVYLWGAFAMGFLQRLFPLDAHRRIVPVVFAVNGALAAVMAALPARWLAYLLPVLHIDAIIIITLYALIIVRAALAHREFATYATLGLLTVILSALLDIAAVVEIIPDQFEYLPWGFVLYCVIQSAGMSRDFILIQRRSRRLAVDNEKLKKMIARPMRTGKHTVTGDIENKINAAVGYLRDNFAEDISRENLAATLDLHPDSFSRYFRMHTGKKYSEFLNDLRVAEAIRLLGMTDQPVITVAMNVGFNSLRTFNHAFLNATGKKPSDFRR